MNEWTTDVSPPVMRVVTPVAGFLRPGLGFEVAIEVDAPLDGPPVLDLEGYPSPPSGAVSSDCSDFSAASSVYSCFVASTGRLVAGSTAP